MTMNIFFFSKTVQSRNFEQMLATGVIVLYRNLYRGYQRKAKLRNGTKIDLLKKKSHRPTYFEFNSYLNCL